VTAPSPEDSEDVECFTDISTCNSFAGLPDFFDHDDEAHVPACRSTERVEGRMQQRFEFMCRNRKEAITIHLHRAHGHPNNRTLLLNLEAAGLPCKHLKRYVLAMSCDAGTMALYDDLAIHNTLAIAKAFLRHSVKFVLTPHYRPDVMGEMRVIDVDTKKLTKTKAVLIVKFFDTTISQRFHHAHVLH